MRSVKLTTPWREFDFSKLGGLKTACVFRTAAFGDLIQASSLFHVLYDHGYKVTVVVGEYGMDVIKHDPHIDTIFLQPHDAVENKDLGEYWKLLSRPFEKFINLSESIERSLLAFEGDKSFEWPTQFRDLLFSVDYLDATHAVGGYLGYPKKPKFYRTAKEEKWAKDFRTKLGMVNKIVLFALSGSAVHKAWPHMDTLIARLMIEHKDVKIVFVGDNYCRILEAPWRKEPRVICKSGKWSIRETLSVMLEADMVLGPETGVLNAAAYEAMPKVLLLSHSSPKNIGGSWINTFSIEPDNTDCYPCHKMHYSWDTCCRDIETGLSLCASNISADKVYDAVIRGLYE